MWGPWAGLTGKIEFENIFFFQLLVLNKHVKTSPTDFLLFTFTKIEEFLIVYFTSALARLAFELTLNYEYIYKREKISNSYCRIRYWCAIVLKEYN
jgi:hypothetical protein